MLPHHAGIIFTSCSACSVISRPPDRNSPSGQRISAFLLCTNTSFLDCYSLMVIPPVLWQTFDPNICRDSEWGESTTERHLNCLMNQGATESLMMNSWPKGISEQRNVKKTMFCILWLLSVKPVIFIQIWKPAGEGGIQFCPEGLLVFLPSILPQPPCWEALIVSVWRTLTSGEEVLVSTSVPVSSEILFAEWLYGLAG